MTPLVDCSDPAKLAEMLEGEPNPNAKPSAANKGKWNLHARLREYKEIKEPMLSGADLRERYGLQAVRGGVFGRRRAVWAVGDTCAVGCCFQHAHASALVCMACGACL